MLCRLIAPNWLPSKYKKVLEGEFTQKQIEEYNGIGYNIFYLPNYPSKLRSDGSPIDGTDIDTWQWVFVDCDIKDGVYKTKDEFLELVLDYSGLQATKVIDSGNGIHIYWKIVNLDAKSYLRFQRRLMRLFKTDPAVGKLFQLMRLEGTLNTKNKDKFKPCILLGECDLEYTAEQFDKLLPPITKEDEQFCEHHYNSTFGITNSNIEYSDKLPAKFGKLIATNQEAKHLWTGDTDDRSVNDFRLGHIMFANGFTRSEAMSVLVNCNKAMQRAPHHRENYAKNIIDKIWTFELSEDKDKLDLSLSVKDILQKSVETLKGTPLRCHPRIDNTAHGFRLGQVIGLVAGSGVGKTAFALNMFKWISERNPEYHHFFVPLEQPANEIADRWKTMCGDDESLHEKVHVMSNYDEQGNFRHLSLDDVREYIIKFQEVTKFKVGCVVIDHIGALKKSTKDGENQGIMDICHAMKAFAVQTNTLLIMQSQSNREKAGIGDLELNKDAAYGTVFFESYCDYLITLWQPLKRMHSDQACPTVTAFKYCKIRHKKPRKDIIQEDVPYYMYFDSDTELMRDLTQDEKTSFDFFLPMATNKRKIDRKTELLKYQAVQYEQTDNNRQA